MLKLPTSPLIFYPAYCFPLSPTYNTWARLTAIDVNALRERRGFEGQNLYFHLNHPIKWVRLVGLIVSFELVLNRFILILDDFSGVTLELTCIRKVPPTIQRASPNVEQAPLSEEADQNNLNGSAGPVAFHVPLEEAEAKGITANGNEVDLSHVDVGSIVKVKGGIGEFRGQKQILVERISVIKSTTDETAAWEENLEFRRSVLAKPWVLTEAQIQTARLEAEGRGRDGKSKRRTRAKGHGDGKKVRKGAERLASMNADLRNGASESGGNDGSRQRKDAKRTRIDDEQRKSQEEEERRRRLELENAQRKERLETLRKMEQEQERKRREEDEEKRKVEEERKRLAIERRRRNEARMKALRELGAGR